MVIHDNVESHVDEIATAIGDWFDQRWHIVVARVHLLLVGIVLISKLLGWSWAVWCEPHCLSLIAWMVMFGAWIIMFGLAHTSADWARVRFGALAPAGMFLLKSQFSLVSTIGLGIWIVGAVYLLLEPDIFQLAITQSKPRRR